MKEGNYIHYVFHNKHLEEDIEYISLITSSEEKEDTYSVDDVYASNGEPAKAAVMFKKEFTVYNEWTPEEFAKVHPEYLI